MQRPDWKAIVMKAWTDEAFKKRLLEDPESLAKEYGLNLPKGIRIQVHENTEKVVHVVIPQKHSTNRLDATEMRLISAAGNSDDEKN